MENVRIPVDLSSDKNINFKLEQDFEQLEILSLKLSAYDVYAQMTSDFGVVVGRVNVNGGFGVQNAKISIFVPISSDDELRSEILQLYPFKGVLDKLPNGVRYNLFPRIKQSNLSHQPIGIFPDVTDLTYYPTYLEVYDKYYKFTTTTNDSGDYMIFGVPLGAQFVHMDFDLFDTKSFYVTADDLVTEIKASATISEQLGSELTQAINPQFELTSDGLYQVKLKADIDSMPNIYSDNKMVNVVAFWGDKSIHDIGITRCDFNLSYEYVPTAIFFGSFLNMSYWSSINLGTSSYQVDVGNNGQGQSISVQNAARDLKVVTYKLLDAYKVERYGIFSGVPSGTGSTNWGVFVLNLPMYEDYYVTDELGQLVSAGTNDDGTPKKRGIPTKGHYVFEFFDDNEHIYGNGRRSPVGWEHTNYWSNLTAGIRVPADRNGHQYLSGWRTDAVGDNTLFEYDILKGSPRFYTVQVEYRKHQGTKATDKLFEGVDVRYSGNVLAYLPIIDTASDYNIPIDCTNPPDPAIMRGTLYSPRFLVQSDLWWNPVDGQLESKQNLLLYPNELTWIPWYSKDKTGNYATKSWDWVFGVGVQLLQGTNKTGLFTELYPEGSGFDVTVAEETRTWFFGDNPYNGENPPVANYYAQLLAQRPESTGRNFNGVHNRFNLAVSPNFTAGLFASSVNFGIAKILFETSIVDITDVLPELVQNSVYSSYGLTNNKYKDNYYLFGTNKEYQNALYVIKKRYFNG